MMAQRVNDATENMFDEVARLNQAVKPENLSWNGSMFGKKSKKSDRTSRNEDFYSSDDDKSDDENTTKLETAVENKRNATGAEELCPQKYKKSSNCSVKTITEKEATTLKRKRESESNLKQYQISKDIQVLVQTLNKIVRIEKITVKNEHMRQLFNKVEEMEKTLKENKDYWSNHYQMGYIYAVRASNLKKDLKYYDTNISIVLDTYYVWFKSLLQNQKHTFNLHYN